MFMGIYIQRKSMKTCKKMLPNKFRTVVTLRGRAGGIEKRWGRIVVGAFIMLGCKRPNKNDLKQINRRLIFVKSRQVDT